MFPVSQRYTLLLILILFVSILSLVYFTAFRNSREKYINYWGLSWIMYGLSLVFNIILISQPATLMLAAGKQFCDLLNSLFLLAGTYSFVGRRFPAYWIQFTAINVIWIALAVYYQLSYLMITLLASIFFSIVAMVNGIMLQTSLGKNPFGRIIVISVFLVWGSYKAYYPYLYPAFNNSSIGYSVELILANLMNLAIMIIYLRKIREELTQSESLFRVFAENAQDMIFVYRIEPVLEYLYVSPACKKILGYGQEFFYQNNMMLASITHPEDKLFLDTLFDPSANLHEPITLRLKHRQGHYVWTEQKTAFQFDDVKNSIQVEGILRDITDRKKVEEELILAQASRQTLLANVSHELRTPITSIVGYLSVMKSIREKQEAIKKQEVMEKQEALENQGAISAHDPIVNHNIRTERVQPDDEGTDYLEFIYKKSLHLQRLVQDLFQLTQYDSGQGYFNFSQITIRELIEQAVEKYQIDVTERKHSFHLSFEQDPEFLGAFLIIDEERIDQVFTNIIYNSIKYTPAGGEISIQLGYQDDNKKALLVSISDTGDGIDQEELERIFERFYRSKKNDRTKDGGGLGLTISKEIIERHKGNIWAESELGKGSIFLFTIPIYGESSML